MKIELIDKTLIFCASRGSGKSCLMKWLIEKQKDSFQEIFLISPTETINSQFKDIVKEEFIYDEYDEKWMESLINKMTEVNKGKEKKEDKTHILLILDDCCSDANLSKMPSFKKIFTRGSCLLYTSLLGIHFYF